MKKQRPKLVRTPEVVNDIQQRISIRVALPASFITLQMHRCQRGALPASFITLQMHRCQRGALPASFIALQVNKTIIYNTLQVV